MAVVGDPIHLDYQLHDYSTDKFVRAIIKADGVEITNSPVNVPHVGDGAYFFRDIVNLLFPSGVDEIAITYSVYRDAALTQRIRRYGAGRDGYRLIGINFQEVEDALDNIKKAIDQMRVIDANVLVEVDSTEIHLVIQPEDVLEFDVSMLQEDNVEIEIAVNETLDMLVEQENNNIELIITE